MEPVRGAVALALLLAAATAARAAEPSGAPPDAEMLRDLDVVGSPTYTRDRELGRRLPLIERLRVLEMLRQAEAAAPVIRAGRPSNSSSRTPSNPKEVK